MSLRPHRGGRASAAELLAGQRQVSGDGRFQIPIVSGVNRQVYWAISSVARQALRHTGPLAKPDLAEGSGQVWSFGCPAAIAGSLR